MVTLGGTTTNSATIVWEAGGLDNNWVVEYKVVSDSVWTNFATTTNHSATITNLHPGTFYNVRIGSLCGTDTLFSNIEIFTECVMAETPFREDFNLGKLNPCFTVNNIDPEGSIPELSSNILYLGADAHGYAILPEFVDDINGLRMSYNISSYELNSQLVVAVGTNKDDWSTFIPVDTVATTLYNENEAQITYFNHYQGEGHFIAFYGLSSDIYIDDILVEPTPDCAMPMDLTISQITSDGAILSWVGDNGNSDGWLIYYRNMNTDEIFEDMVIDPFYTFSGLSFDTPYEVMVSNLCGEDIIEALRSVIFRTLCGSISLPFVENFETKYLSEVPSCWISLNGETKIVNARKNTSSGLQSLNIEDDGIILSPYIPVAGNNIGMDMLLKRESADAGQLIVGFTDNSNNISNMQIIDTIAPDHNECALYELDFSNINISTPGYIVWKQINSSEYSYRKRSYYIDDIYVYNASNCMRPQSVTFSDVTNNQAIVSWTPIEGINQYEVMYGNENNINASLNMIVTLNETSATLTNLNSDTTYYVWVRSICNGVDQSPWRNAGSFTTQVDCAQLMDVTIADISTTGIALSWNYNTSIGNPATAVEVAWKANGEADYHTVITHNNYYIITGLLSATNYQLRLRSICSNDTSEAYTRFVATNSCGVALDQSTTTDSHIPTACMWNYSYAQMVYPADKLENVNTIQSIAFHLYSDIVTTRNWDIYMGHIKRSVLSASDYVTMDSLQLVGSNVSFTTGQGWCSVELTTPFVHQGDSNLVIVIDDNTGSYVSGIDFYVHDGSSLCYHHDSNNPDPANPYMLTSSSLIPDIKFVVDCTTSLCESPLLVLKSITENTANLVWSRSNDSDTWQVEYKLASDHNWTIFNNNITDTFATISNLQSGSFYQFRVGLHCAEGIQYSSIDGFTTCAVISAPISETFDDAILNPCWVYGNLNEGGSTPELRNHTLYMGHDAGGYVVMPEFSNDIANLHALFSINSINENSQIIVAIGNEPNDWNTFTPIDTFTVSANNAISVQECNFNNYVGNGHYIAFYCPSGKVFIDDITIETIPSCSLPTDLAISNVSADQATITWNGDNRLTSAWLVDYNVVGDANITHQRVSSNQFSYTMTGLSSNTLYEVSVYNVCSMDTVAALMPLTFRTECGTITLPYHETFENEITNTYHSCWFSTNAHSYGDADNLESAPIVIQLSDVHSKVLKFGDNVSMITPRIPIASNSILLNFDVMADDVYNTGKLLIGFSTEPVDTALLIVDTLDLRNTEWSNYEVSFSELTTTDTGYIVLKNIDNEYTVDSYGNRTYYNGYLDNISVMIDNGCKRVSNIVLNNPTQTSIDISFSDTNASGSYTIAYATINNLDNAIDSVDITTTNYTLNGLQANTTYYLWIRNNCMAGNSPWSTATLFHTSCGAISVLPYIENFDSYIGANVSSSAGAPNNYPDHQMPNCWSFINMSSSRSDFPQAFLSTHYSYIDSGACLFMKSSINKPIYAILPQFTTPIDSLQISFAYRNEGVNANNGTLALGVMTDISDTSSFIVIREYPKIQQLTTVSHSFSMDELDPSNTYTSAFRYTGIKNNFYLGIENVIVEQSDNCIIPESVTVVNASSNTVSLSWIGNSSSYNVQYRSESETDWTDAPIVTSNTTIVTGLTPQVEYFFRIQSICGNAVSEWSEVVKATTLCGAKAIPYSENFDEYTTGISTSTYAPENYPNHALPDCWTFPILGAYSYDYPIAFLTSSSSYADSANCLFFKSSDVKYIYAVLPEMAD